MGAQCRCVQFHKRLYLIDTQVKHCDKISLNGLARWLSRKWYHCLEKQESAVQGLSKLGLSQEFLRAQWSDQVKVQTAPSPRLYCFVMADPMFKSFV